ncbi:MAG: formylglycine-generating enzyme family protein [Planctomycetota bacterium]
MRKAIVYRLRMVTGLLLFATPALGENTAPQVTNVTAGQRSGGSNLVDIGYDLTDVDGNPCRVWVFVSRNGGATWNVAATSFTGDYGEGITPGTGKAIVWNVGADVPGTYGENFKVRVYADDGQGTPPAMVLIPGGEYQMGDHFNEGGTDERPVHAVNVGSFYMDIYEVTNQEYVKYLNSAFSQGLIEVRSGVAYAPGDTDAYCDTTTSSSGSRITWNGSAFGVTPGKEEHPMVMVSWYGAAAYANWRSSQHGRTPCYNLLTWECNFAANGYRLPTEAEWEYAARGGNRNPYRRYPWGDAISWSMANYWDTGDPYESGSFPYTTPVGYYDGNQIPAGVDMVNGYGLYDVAGNAWEWCNDWYSSTYYSSSPYDNPIGPANATYRVLRGGSWSSPSHESRCASRFGNVPGVRTYSDGFRLALDAE